LERDIRIELFEGSLGRIWSEGEDVKSLLLEVVGGTVVGDTVLHPVVERRLGTRGIGDEENTAMMLVFPAKSQVGRNPRRVSNAVGGNVVIGHDGK
jgi:hypothetical protein